MLEGEAMEKKEEEEKKPDFELFIKASSDANSVGNCPFSQRLFMILWLKGVTFIVTTVDMKRKPEVLKKLAPGSQPPFLRYKEEIKTDTNKIEEFLEETLAPPQYEKLCCRYKESNKVGEDIFRTFSAYIKNDIPARDKGLEKKFLITLATLSQYLETPLTYEIDKNPNITESSRLYLDGDRLTLADCNLLPKLNIIRVACKEYLNILIPPPELKGLTRYLTNAYKECAFSQTCPMDMEINNAYKTVAKYRPEPVDQEREKRERDREREEREREERERRERGREKEEREGRERERYEAVNLRTGRKW